MQTVSSSQLHTMISRLLPTDALEQNHITDTCQWINSGAPLFRLQKPAIPPKHLCVYFVLVDIKKQQILLVDHRQAGLWLPSGGHVELDEHPHETVKRECLEELGVRAEFISPAPFFLTSTLTQGLQPGHIDVSLWYILKGDSHQEYTFDAQEFHTIRWFSFEEIPYEKAEPHMKRFISKLKTFLTPS